MFGGGASSIQDMINRMKTNREMVKKHDYFKKRKKELENIHFTNQTESLTEESINYYLEKNRKEKRYYTLFSAITLISIMLLLFAILFGVFSKFGTSS